MRFTVFTPSYNRAYTLMRLYESLKKQTFTDFEWILVDDGSTDNTNEFADHFSKDEERKFPFIYKKVQNGGKHRAINLGVSMARGELFFIVDSDDYLVEEALQKADAVERSIPQNQKSKFGGICGLKGYNSNDIVGSTYEGSDYLDITALERKENNISGDKAEIFYTEILKQYPFPEFKDEKFITECVVWDKIAYDGYKLRFFNDIIYICDYLDDGLSHNLNKCVKQSPIGEGLYLYQCQKFKKFDKKNEWIRFMDYYHTFKKDYSIWQIADFLHQKRMVFFCRVVYTRAKNLLRGVFK